MRFKGRLLIVGLGSVCRCALPLILKHIDLAPENVVLMDFVECPSWAQFGLDRGVKFVQERISQNNYQTLLPKYVSDGDIILDLAWDIDTCSILDWCYRNGVRFLNTSVEVWDPYTGVEHLHPTERTLYSRQMRIRRMIDAWPDPKGPTAVVEHGANPGLVSHFTKAALVDIASRILNDNPQPSERNETLRRALRMEDFAKLAQLSGVKVIHISERDSQISDCPKQVNEFVNTWSVEGFHEEGIAPAEMGWGMHEKQLPPNAVIHRGGPGNQICLAQMGCRTMVRSWVPSGEIVGMVIRHGEAFSISDHLTVWQDGIPVFRPTVHYAYLPCDAAVASLWELEMLGYNRLQEKRRIMTDEIIEGRDELGCLLMGHDYKGWWIGSLLDIHESRELVPHNNATVLQVAAPVVAALAWMIRNPMEGYCLPDDLPYREILDFCKPYLGTCKSMPVDWTPLSTKRALFTDFTGGEPRPEDVWQFSTFLVKS
jgi:homospermidine synthase